MCVWLAVLAYALVVGLKKIEFHICTIPAHSICMFVLII